MNAEIKDDGYCQCDSGIERLRSWCKNKGLDPKTIKEFSSLRNLIPLTALAFMGQNRPLWGTLTEQEREIGRKINLVPKIAVVDIDGVLFNHQSNEQNPPENFWQLREIAGRVDKLIFWTSRVSLNEESLLWRGLLSRHFDHSGTLPKFPFLTDQKIAKLKRHFLSLNTEVVHGPKILNNGIKKITDLILEYKDPYVLFIGSGPLDASGFKKVIEELIHREFPFDQVVFCTNGDLNNFFIV